MGYAIRPSALNIIVLGLTLVSFCRAQDKYHVDSALPIISAKQTVNIATPNVFHAGELKWSRPIDHPDNTNWLRLHIRLNKPGPTNSWRLVILGSGGSTVDEISGEMCAIEHDVWTRMIPGNQAIVELRSSADIQGLELLVVDYDYQVPSISPKALRDPPHDHRVPLVQKYPASSQVYKSGRSVAAVFFPDPNEPNKPTNCTGFLLAPSLLLTNHHCVNAKTRLRSVDVYFDYDYSAVLGHSYAVASIAACSDTDVSSETIECNKSKKPGLDYSLLRLSEAVAVPISPAERRDISGKDELMLIQHPDGRPKMIADDCKSQDEKVAGRAMDFFHLCDSSWGSSGSPVMLKNGRVIGLHHMGASDSSKRSSSNKYHNMAVMMRLVLDDIQAQALDAFEEIKRAQLPAAKTGRQ